jgi:hypothetical protein
MAAITTYPIADLSTKTESDIQDLKLPKILEARVIKAISEDKSALCNSHYRHVDQSPYSGDHSDHYNDRG